MTSQGTSDPRGTLVPCALCGVEVHRPPSRLAKNQGRAFCSSACYHEARRQGIVTNRGRRSDAGQRKVEHVTRECDFCGAEVVRRASDYRRRRVFCSQACSAKAARRDGRPGRPAKRQVGDVYMTDDGYRYVFVGRGQPMANSRGLCAEHRLVVAEHLGRPLLAEENVHHINGDRRDNRIANLELWLKRQPPGQRAADLLVWAREIVATYEEVSDLI